MLSPAAERNKDPILAVLRRALPEQGRVLEIASGSGQHAVHFAAALPGLTWQPSDPDRACRDAIATHVQEVGLPNLKPPLDLDVTAKHWPVDEADAVVCINMIHISPWESTPALLAGASRILRAPAPIVLYGPFRRGDRALEPSNEAFDASLKARNPEWGLREIERVSSEAERYGFECTEVVDLPANNIAVVYRRDDGI